jgi:hypothetical protein
VNLLLEAGHPVVPVKPNAIKTWRDGEVLQGAKSAGDAAVIAGYLRLRAHWLRPAAPYSHQTLALRTVVRARGDLAGMRVAATSQLSALLDAHWSGAKAIFADVESPISLEFLTRYDPGRRPRTWGRSGWPRSASNTATATAAPPPNCSPTAPHRLAPAARRSPKRCATPCSPPSACSRP